MRKRRFTKNEVIDAVRAHADGVAVAAICQRHGISERTFGRWRAKYGDGGAAPARCIPDRKVRPSTDMDRQRNAARPLDT